MSDEKKERITIVYPVGEVYSPSDLLVSIRKRRIVWGARGGYRGDTWEITDEEADALIAAHDARLLDEAAERAVGWLKTLHHEPEPGLPWSDKIRKMQDLQIRTLRAAVRGKE